MPVWTAGGRTPSISQYRSLLTLIHIMASPDRLEVAHERAVLALDELRLVSVLGLEFLDELRRVAVLFQIEDVALAVGIPAEVSRVQAEGAEEREVDFQPAVAWIG